MCSIIASAETCPNRRNRFSTEFRISCVLRHVQLTEDHDFKFTKKHPDFVEKIEIMRARRILDPSLSRILKKNIFKIQYVLFSADATIRGAPHNLLSLLGSIGRHERKREGDRNVSYLCDDTFDNYRLIHNL